MKEGLSSHLWSAFDGNCIFVDGLGAIWKIFIQTNQKRPEAKVDFGGQTTTLSKWYQINSRSHPQYLVAHPWPKILKKSDHRWQLQPFFIISPISLFLVSGLYLKHFFSIFGHGWAPRYWEWPLELIWYHFDRVAIWSLRSTLSSGLFFQIANKKCQYG